MAFRKTGITAIAVFLLVAFPLFAGPKETESDRKARNEFEKLNMKYSAMDPGGPADLLDIMMRKAAELEALVLNYPDAKITLPDVYDELGKLYAFNKKYDSAIANFEQIPKLVPKTDKRHLKALMDVSVCLNFKCDYDNALDYCKQAAKLATEKEVILQNGSMIAELYARLGKADSALDEINGMMKKFTDNDSQLLLLRKKTAVCARLGLYDEEISAWQKILEKAKDNRVRMSAMTEIAGLYSALGDKEKCKKQIADFKKKFGMHEEEYKAILKMLDLCAGNEPYPFEVIAMSGRKVALADYKGKVVLLDFWSSWNPDSETLMPDTIKAYDKYNPDGFEIIGIVLDTERPMVEKVIKDDNMRWEHFFDGKGFSNEIGVMYGISMPPMNILIDKKGVIRYKKVYGDRLVKAVEELLKE